MVRRNIADGVVTYAGFLNAQQAWITGQDQVVAQAAYVGLPPFAVLPAGNPPAGTVTCMASGAAYDNSWIAPGEILAVFGNAIGPAQAFHTELDANGNVAKSLGGMTVSIGGVAAPILYTDAGQINLVVPFGIPTGGTAPVRDPAQRIDHRCIRRRGCGNSCGVYSPQTFRAWSAGRFEPGWLNE